ncbi:MAG TPA: hypothetical protein VIM00_00985 [Candidatus Acidoferrum sp.]|jgi:hypothetical protein
MPATSRPLCSAILAALLFSSNTLAFSTALSDEAVRDAYFLGQHHDASVVSYLDKYVKHLPAPKTGPYISSIAFFTPFAQWVELSDRRMGNYSAQQAEQDHRGHKEFVRIDVEIDLTPTYGPFLSTAELGVKPPSGLVLRSADFWRDFTFQIHQGDRLLDATTLRGNPKYICGDQYGSCNLTGASVQLELPADSFASDTATVVVTPPAGAELSAQFDLNALR